MKTYTSFLKLGLVSLVASVFAVLALSPNASAIPYVEGVSSTSATPVFNQYTGVPITGDESDFVRLRNSDGDSRSSAASNKFIDPVDATCNVGDKFDIRTYVHNGSSETLNDNGNGSAVAKNTTVSITAPLGTTAKKFTFGSTISATNATSVNDTGTLNCEKSVQLKLVANTVYASADGAWYQKQNSAVNGTMKIGSRDTESGDVWGCWDERVQVVYTVEVVEAPEEPKPIYTCDLLAVSFISDRKFKFTVTATVKNGPVIEGYIFDFGDGTPEVNSESNTVEHTYTKAGVYTAKGAVNVETLPNKGGIVTSDNCESKVEVEEEKEVEKCEIEGKGHLAKDHDDCKKEEVKAATTLPNTGAGNILGIMTVVTAAGAYMHRAYTLKRQ